MNDLLCAVIPALVSLAGVIVTCAVTAKATRSEVARKLDVTCAVTDTKIEELTREVREHNNFARRMPVVEEQIKVINHRISDLEGKA